MLTADDSQAENLYFILLDKVFRYEVSGSVFGGGQEICVRDVCVVGTEQVSRSLTSVWVCSPLGIQCLTTNGRSASLGSGVIGHHVAVFPGKQNAILSPSCVITALIIATIFDPSVPSIKVVVSVIFLEYSTLQAFFSPIFALSLIEQLPEMWWGHSMQKVIRLSFFPVTEARVSGSYLSCWSMKLELMCEVTFWKKKKVVPILQL